MTGADLHCAECGQPCKPLKDGGIGPYEFWGRPCHDPPTDLISDCCGAAVVDALGMEVSLADWQREEAGRRCDEVFDTLRDRRMEESRCKQPK